ncbi:MAG: MFS transporter [Actinomycetota bacterium]|nr:MFS transporter [Actinomycetota bacterium]
MNTAPGQVPAADEVNRRAEQRAWSWYDWANSAYATTIGAVLFAPYLTSVAEVAACGQSGTVGAPCRTDLSVLGVAVSPGSLVFYVITVSTVLSALVLPVVGAIADRSNSKRRLMGRLAWTGAAMAVAMFTVSGGNWQLGAALLLIGNIAFGASLVVYDAILCEIATPDERDAVSSRAWAFGYLGGGLLLAVNLAIVTLHESLGLSTAMAVRVSLASAGLWWALFTFIPYRRLRDRPPRDVVPATGPLVRRSFGQLVATLRDARNYPMTLTFLLAYLFYNDGIQTVIGTASVYGDKQLGFETGALIATILLVQFVAFGGALLFGRIAARLGSRRTILAGLWVWIAVVGVGYLLPAGELLPFLALATAIGIVLGGTQALSRSLFSQLIPPGREAEYFSLYQACERGTSWLGTLVFGLVQQTTDSYRPALAALAIFFVVGFVLLLRVDVRRAIVEAGNLPPKVV